MAESQFRAAFAFLDQLGVFDVVLPFLLVFTITFAMLEKSKVFGTEKGADNAVYTKKNLNALASFAIAFFTIASAKVVDAITQISANVVILMFSAVFFLMLVGSFSKEEEKGIFLGKPWNTIFTIIMFLGLFGIFLNAIKTSDGQTWLEFIFDWLGNFSSDVSVATIVLVAVVIGAMYLVIGTGGKKGGGSAPAAGHP